MIFETCSRACINTPFLKGIMVHLVVFQRWNKVFSSIIQMQRSGFNLCTGQFQNCPSPPPPPLSIWLEFCTVQWRIWSKIRPAQFVIWLSCQYRKQRDFVILSTFSMCTTFMGQCSFTIFFGAFARLWKKHVRCGLYGMKWTNLCKTAFRDFRYFGCVL